VLHSVRLLGEGLALGLAGGTACLTTCAPVLLPFLVAESDRPRWSLQALASFLLGRLAGYLTFAVIAWVLGTVLLHDPARRAVLLGAAYLALATLLIVYGFTRPRTACAAEPVTGLLGRIRNRWPAAFPASLGLLTGLSVCPPFLLAIARGADAGGLSGALLFFVAFFCGTSIFLLPLPLVGLLRRPTAVRTIGRLTAGVAGVYFAYLGLTALLGGLLT
jgi:sulfite exporter TauE/SafE